MPFLDIDKQSGMGKVWVEISSKRVYRLFMEVWGKLPDVVRQDVFRCVNKVTDLAPADIERGVKAQTRMLPWGGEVYLLPRRYRKVSDEEVKYFIAHEIGHAIWHNPYLDDVPEEDVEEMEDFADTCADEWGFPNPHKDENLKKIMSAYKTGHIKSLATRHEKQMEKLNEQYFGPTKKKSA